MENQEIADFLHKVHIGDYVALDCEFQKLFGGTEARRESGYVEILTPLGVHLSETNPLENPRPRIFLPGRILYWAIKSYEIKR